MGTQQLYGATENTGIRILAAITGGESPEASQMQGRNLFPFTEKTALKILEAIKNGGTGGGGGGSSEDLDKKYALKTDMDAVKKALLGVSELIGGDE